MPSRRMGLSISMVVLFLGVAYVVLIIRGDQPRPLEFAGADILTLGASVYAESCAACHGVNLEGEPGFDWRRKKPDGTFPGPPHDETGHTWHHPDAFLFAYTTNGGQVFLGENGVSAMPAFADVLSVQEVEAVLEYIKDSWPEAIRARQRRATEAARGR